MLLDNNGVEKSKCHVADKTNTGTSSCYISSPTLKTKSKKTKGHLADKISRLGRFTSSILSFPYILELEFQNPKGRLADKIPSSEVESENSKVHLVDKISSITSRSYGHIDRLGPGQEGWPSIE